MKEKGCRALQKLPELCVYCRRLELAVGLETKTTEQQPQEDCLEAATFVLYVEKVSLSPFSSSPFTEVGTGSVLFTVAKS